jgi:hypothetical protein
MATPKSVWDFGRFLSPARIFALLPHALWFLAFLVAEAPRPPRALGRVAGAGVVALALVGLGLRQGDYEHRVADLRDAATTAVYGFATPTPALERRCARLERRARAAGASVVVFLTDKAGAYGCGALGYGRLDTLLPAVERRTWRLYEERARRREAALVQGVGPDYCAYARPRVRSCRRVGPDTVALRFAPQSLLALLAVLNVSVRGFGPRCHPEPFGLGAFLCPEGLRPSLAELRTGPPPPDPGGARAAIAAAFAAALDPAAGFATVEDGSTIRAKVEARPEAYRAALGDAAARVDGIQFLSPTLALAALHVRSGARTPPGRYRAWAIRIDGSWLVDRNTFCLIESLATLENHWCAGAGASR